MTDAQLDQELHRKVARASFWTRVFIVFVLVVPTAILVTVLVSGHATSDVVNQIRKQQVQSAGTLKSADAAAKDARRTADAINSCVTPGEPCFQLAQKQRHQDKATTRNVIILAAACAVGKTGTVTEIQAQIRACVNVRLAHQRATR